MSSGMTEEQAQAAAGGQDMLRMVESMPMRQFLGFLPEPIPQPQLDELMRKSAEPAAV